MRSIIFLLLAFLFAHQPPNSLAPEESSAGWQMLFDGESLDGWEVRGQPDWTAETGTLSCSASGASWIGTDAVFSDFVLKLEFRGAATVNSGIFVRSQKSGPPHITGYEVQIWDHQPQGYNTGSLVGAVKAVPTQVLGDQWNEFEVTVHGDRYVAQFNGVTLLDAMADPRGPGVIGLQCQPDNPIEFRNLKIRSLPAAERGSLHVNEQRLWETLESLSEFGRPPGAGFEGGVTRLGFSEADLAAREYVIGLMREAGLQVRVDPAGNIFGRREGAEMLPALLFGSHIDTVPNGGNFDGVVGSLGAIEVVRAMNDHGARTRHPLETVIWTNEEGHHFRKGLFGSSAAAGLLEPEVVQRTNERGETLADWLRRYGQDPARLGEARIAPGAYAAYLELHIEQGAVLDSRRIQIGVVEGIVGITWRTCVSTGFANHAGTTPMDRRSDAFAAAARAALAVREEVLSEPGRQVGTVGYVQVEPGAGNIIPGRVEFIVELRDLEYATIDRIWQRIQARFAEIAAEENVAIDCQLVADERPALTDPTIRDAIRGAAHSAALTTIDLPSGAGHDAQQAAHFVPIGMIFVPSREGISHSPREYTAPSDVARGAETLYRTLLTLDEKLNR